MKIDINASRFAKVDLIKAYNKKGYYGLKEMCVVIGISLVSGLHFLIEEGIEVDKATKDRDSLMEYYGYDEIIGSDFVKIDDK